MFTIGEFSRITSLSIKTIRFYHEKGLLIPCQIDGDTGYRYFNHNNVEKARAIIYLRELDFPLDDIKEIIDNYHEDSEIVSFLQNQKSLIELKIKKYRKKINSLTQIIQREQEYNRAVKKNEFDVQKKELETLLIAGIRFKGGYSDCGQAFQKLFKYYGRYICGKPMNLYYNEGYQEVADIETSIPVKRGKSGEGIFIRELKGGRALSLIHRGGWDEVGRSYEKIGNYVKQNGYKIKIPCREVYIKGPGMIFRGNPRNYLTEIQMLIRE